jgi:hypothetical protein
LKVEVGVGWSASHNYRELEIVEARLTGWDHIDNAATACGRAPRNFR